MRVILGHAPAKLLPCAVAAGVVAVLAGCATTPPEEDPVQIKLNELDGRVARIERVVANQSLVQLAQNLETAQGDIRKLRGQIDELQNSNEMMKRRLGGIAIIGGSAGVAGNASSGSLGGGAGYGTSTGASPTNAAGAGYAGGSAGNVAGGASSGGATDSALGAAGVNAVAGGTSSGGAAAGSAPIGSDGTGAAGAAGVAGSAGSAAGSGTPGAPPVSSVEQAVYNQAFEALKAGSYSVAITSFRDFLSSYPASALAENAQYWLGEAYYVTRSYDDASGAFRTVLQKWPASRKAPDALLKLGFTQYEQKRYGEARRTLQEVSQKYPDSDASRLAVERLNRIPASAR